MPTSVADYFVADNYWHSEVWLRSTSGETFRFYCAEYAVARLFDVFALEIESPAAEPPLWTALAKPIGVKAAVPLWRDEWLESGADGETVGNNAHTQCSGPVGRVPPHAVAAATVFAGLYLKGTDGGGIAVIAS